MSSSKQRSAEFGEFPVSLPVVVASAPRLDASFYEGDFVLEVQMSDSSEDLLMPETQIATGQPVILQFQNETNKHLDLIDQTFESNNVKHRFTQAMELNLAGSLDDMFDIEFAKLFER